jgi:LysR family transcriptional regulator for metE and metH
MLPRLDLRHLIVLGALAESGSVTATAHRLGVTQSAVSHRLREAERRLGVALARRGEGGLVLTQEGERLRASAERFLDELGRLERELAQTGGRGRQPVRLGQATYSRYHWLPIFLDYLAERDPRLDVDLSGRATARPFAALIEGTVDVSTVYGRPSALPRFRWYWLASDPLVAVMAPDHRLAADAYVDSRTIGDTRVYTYPLSAEPGFAWEALVGPPAEPFRRLTQMPTPESAIDLMRAGFGIGIFARWAVEPELADGTLIAKPIGEEGLSLDWWAVVRGRDPEDGPAVRLAESLVAWGRRHEQALATLGFGGER